MLRIILLFCLLTSIALESRSQEFRLYQQQYMLDITYSALTDRLYAAVAGDHPEGNAIWVIDPATGGRLERIPCGSEPTVVRCSSDGKTLYIGLLGAPLLRRYDLLTQGFGPDILLEEYYPPPNDTRYPYYAGDIDPIPGQSDQILVAVVSTNFTPDNYRLAVYDGITPRPVTVGQAIVGTDQMAVMENGVTAWGIGHEYAPQAFDRFEITPQGVSKVAEYPGLLASTGRAGFAYKNGRIYTNTGQIFDVSGPGTPVLLTTVDVGQNNGFSDALFEPAIDSAQYFVFTSYNSSIPFTFDGYRFKVYHEQTHALLREDTLPLSFSAGIRKIVSLGKGRVALLARSANTVFNDLLAIAADVACPETMLNLPLAGPVRYACAGDTLQLEAASGYQEYYWSNGAVGQTIELTTSQQALSYRVRANNGCLSNPSESVDVVYENKPDAPIVYVSFGNEVLCPGQSGVIQPLSPGLPAAFFVINQTDTIPNQSNYNAPGAGLYNVVALSAHGCASAPSQAELFPSNTPPLPAPLVAVTGSLETCSNDPVILSAPPGAYAYRWSNWQTTPSIQPGYSGFFAVKLFDAFGCETPWSDTVNVVVKYTPPTLTVVSSGGVLYVDDFFNIGDSLQWYLNGVAIPGATDDSYAPATLGLYTVQNFFQGCASAPSMPAPGNSCQLTLTAEPINNQLTTFRLLANTNGTGSYQYLWSNGSNLGSLEVNQPGNYCVTVTRSTDGCVLTACVDLALNDQTTARVTDGFWGVSSVWAVLNRWDGVNLTAIDTLWTNGSGTAVFEALPAGVYALQAIVPPGHWLSGLYFPTYYQAGYDWTQATLFELKGLRVVGAAPDIKTWSFLPTFFNAPGSGVITGQVVDGGGFFAQAGQGSGGGSGAPLAGVEILLFSADGQTKWFVYTDANGNYAFNGLPFGTYYVYLNLQGYPVVNAVVVLSPDTPEVDGLVFTVTPGNSSVGTGTPFAAPDFRLFPNPAQDYLILAHETTLRWTIENGLGQRQAQGMAEGQDRTNIDVRRLNPGFYRMRLIDEAGRVSVAWFVKAAR